MTSIGDVKLRCIMEFCVGLEKSPTETMKMINSTGKYKKCSPVTVYRWHARFKEGRNLIEDDPRFGRQSGQEEMTTGHTPYASCWSTAGSLQQLSLKMESRVRYEI